MKGGIPCTRVVCLLILLVFCLFACFSYSPSGSHSFCRAVFPVHTSTGVFVDIVGFVVCFLVLKITTPQAK